MDMQGRTVLITGANGAIGREITRGLAHMGASVIMACRNTAAAEEVRAALVGEKNGLAIQVMELDLASLASIRSFADTVSQKLPAVDVLINNAGIFCMKRQETTDGFEQTVGVNYLGSFLLTRLLLPLLQAAPAGRIINVSSNAYKQGMIDPVDFPVQKQYRHIKAYAASKLALILFSRELAERLRATPVTVNAVHPGTVATNIWNLWPGTWYQSVLSCITNRFFSTPAEGARPVIHLAASDEVKGISGIYFDKTTPADIPQRHTDRQLQHELWRLSEELTGIATDIPV